MQDALITTTLPQADIYEQYNYSEFISVES